MKLQKLALTAFALSMTAAFAAGNTTSTNSAKPSSAQTNSAQPSSANSTQASTNMPSMAAKGDDSVRQAQQGLKDKGHDPGAIDGIMGPKTQAALQSFQQAQGISGSGQLDGQTLAALGVQGGAASGAQATSSSTSQGAMSSTNQSAAAPANQPAASSTNETKQ